MAGRVHGAEGDGKSRYMDVASRLEFNPFFSDDEDKAQTPGQTVAEQITFNQKTIAEFIRFGSFMSEVDTKPLFPPSLLGDLLAAGPDEMVKVSTVEEAGRWDINLEGMKEAAPIDKRAAVQTCLNFQAWRFGRQSSPSETDSFDPEALETQPGGGEKMVDQSGYRRGGRSVLPCTARE